MIDLFINVHPSAYDCLDMSIFDFKKIKAHRIACGMTKPEKYDFSEVSDFYPSYASLNSAIFESSIILTIWEHFREICNNEYIGFLHTDIKPRLEPKKLWPKILSELNDKKTTLGVAFPLEFSAAHHNAWHLIDNYVLRPSTDPMYLHRFDLEKSLWDIIKKVDNDIFEFAMENNPPMIYSHMFITSLDIFDKLGSLLRNALEKLAAAELGLWAPHLFERLIGLYCSKLSVVKNVCAFEHYAGSSPSKPSAFALYGTRAYKYFKTSRKIF